MPDRPPVSPAYLGEAGHISRDQWERLAMWSYRNVLSIEERKRVGFDA